MVILESCRGGVKETIILNLNFYGDRTHNRIYTPRLRRYVHPTGRPFTSVYESQVLSLDSTFIL